MKTRLTPQDFELCTLEETHYQYFSYDAITFELTIEPTSVGYLVAQYDHNGILVGRRKPVLFERRNGAQEAFASAVDLCSQMYVSKMHGFGALAAGLA